MSQEEAGAVLGRWTTTLPSTSASPSVVTVTWRRGSDRTVVAGTLVAKPLPNAIREAATTVFPAIFEPVTAPGAIFLLVTANFFSCFLPTLCFGSAATA